MNDLKYILRKTKLIKYRWACGSTDWYVQYLNDEINRHTEYEYIMDNRYDLSSGVYFYRDNHHKLILFAKLTDRGIKYYE